METTGPPEFLGNPDSRLHMFQRPGRPSIPDRLRNARVAPAMCSTKGAGNEPISEFDSMAFGLAVYVSRLGRPFPAQDSLQVLVRLSWAGFPPARFR